MFLPPSGPDPIPAGGAALKIAALYTLLGGAWIVTSDRLLGVFVPDPGLQSRLQTYKGWFYVLITALLLFLVIRRDLVKIQRSEHRLRGIKEFMPDALLLIGPSGVVIDANRAARELLGMEGAEILTSVSELSQRLEFRTLEGQPFSAIELYGLWGLDGVCTAGREARLRRSDGRELYVSFRAASIGDGEGQRLIIAILRDVTELRQLAGLRDEFLSAAAHELKTPITTIKVYAQLLDRWAPGGHEPREGNAFKIINQQCDRINRRVQDLLEVSRFQLGRSELRSAPFELVPLAREVIERMRTGSRRDQLRLEGEEQVRVEADRDRIEQVLANLIDNALRFSPSGSLIRVRIDRAPHEAIVSVEDRGVGIPPERQSRIFERYAHAHAGTPYDVGGMGIGLFLSRELVTRLGGRMWFRSTPGQGSTFYFSLPVAEGSAHDARG